MYIYIYIYICAYIHVSACICLFKFYICAWVWPTVGALIPVVGHPLAPRSLKQESGKARAQSLARRTATKVLQRGALQLLAAKLCVEEGVVALSGPFLVDLIET